MTTPTSDVDRRSPIDPRRGHGRPGPEPCDTPAATTTPVSERALELHPAVALRPEPFGALAYHYDTRRLVFVKHPDVVRVVRELGNHPTVADTLVACDIDAGRRPAFEHALAGLIDSEMLHDRSR